MTESARKSSPACPIEVLVPGCSMTHLPSLPACEGQSPHGGTRNLRGGRQKAALQPCEQFSGKQNFRRCSLHHDSFAFLCSRLIKVSNYLIALPRKARAQTHSPRMLKNFCATSRERQNESRNAHAESRK